jgi:PIN domain nuclease of toxin-antitoxin system
MKFLLDTQIFIWWDSEPEKLPKRLLALQTLPLHHKDPFDRLIIAQSLTEKLPVMTVDRLFEQYPASTLGLSR